jgi:large subunit ribosomal protein L32
MPAGATTPSPPPTLVPCPECKAMRPPHTVCPQCGYYDGRKVLEV